MSKISIERNIELETEEAVALLKGLSGELKSKYNIDFDWQNECSAQISSSMANGECSIDGSTLLINVKLGLLTRGFKPQIEKLIHQELDKYC